MAGYGDASTDVPDTTIAAIKFLVAHLYLYREPVAQVVAKLPFTFRALLRTEAYGHEW